MDAVKNVTAKFTTTPPTVATWAKTWGSGSESVSSIQQTADGGYIVAGSTSSFGAGGSNVWVLKLAATGTPEWQNTYGGSDDDSASSIQQTSDGGYIVAGSTSSFGAGGDAWVIKLYGNGQVEWSKAYGGTGNDGASSVQQTSDGGYILAGGGLGYPWIIKLDSTGTVVWQNMLSNVAGGSANAIQQTADGGYIVAGNVVVVGSTTHYDIWIMKLDSDGTMAWQKIYGGAEYDYATSIQETSDGGYIVAGQTDSFGGATTNAWILKLNDIGGVVWQNIYGGLLNDSASSVHETADGGYIVAGTTSFVSGGGDAWIFKLNGNDGSVAWQKSYGGTYEDSGKSIQQTADGGFIMAGKTPHTGGVWNSDIWVLKLDANGNILGCPGGMIGNPSITTVGTTAADLTTPAVVLFPTSVEPQAAPPTSVATTVTGDEVCTGTVNYATTTTVDPATATFSTGDQDVVLSASVTSSGGTVDDGTVTFTVKNGSTVIGVAVTSGTVTGGIATATYTLPHGTPAGVYTIDAAYSGGLDFETSTGTGTLTVGATTQTINVTANAPPSAAYNTSFTVVATATSGLGVAITTSGACTGSGAGSATITMTSGTGTCTVNYNQAGDSSYNAAPEVTENTTATVPSYALTVITSGLSGTVRSTPAGVTCGSDCSEPYKEGTIVTLKADPAAGSYFAGWSGGCVSQALTCKVTVDAVKAVTATFTTTPPVVATWAKTYGGAGLDYAGPIQQTTDGGYIVAGYTKSFGAGDLDAWIIKLDGSGVVEWQNTYGGSDSDALSSIQQTVDEGYIVAGRIYPLSGIPDAWIMKLNSSGVVEWQNTYGGSGWDDARSVQQTSDGGYIVAGETQSFGAGSSDIWIVKLYGNGAVEWQNTYGGSDSDSPFSIQQTVDGGYIVAGQTLSFGAGDFDAWIIKLDGSGVVEWQNTYGGSNSDALSSIQQTADGGYIVAGGTSSFGAVSFDIWIVKLYGNGAVEWQNTYGGLGNDRAFSIQQTADGGYIMAGETQSFGEGNSDVWIMKLNADGTVGAWQQTYGGEPSDYVRSIQQTADGGYIVAGYTMSFGAGSGDAWVLKLDANGSILGCSDGMINGTSVSGVGTAATVTTPTVITHDDFSPTVAPTNATPAPTAVLGEEVCSVGQEGTTTAVSPVTATFSIGDQTFTLNATVTSGSTVNEGTVTFTLMDGSLTVIGSAVTSETVADGIASASYILPGITPAGVYTIEAAYSGGSNFQPSTGTGTLSVGKASQTIIVYNPAPPTANNGTVFYVQASATSGLPVAITSTGVCNGSGANSATITMTSGTGTCTVHYNQAGDSTYNPATEVIENTTAQMASQTIIVYNPAPPTANNGTVFYVQASATSGLPVAITSTGVCNGSEPTQPLSR